MHPKAARPCGLERCRRKAAGCANVWRAPRGPLTPCDPLVSHHRMTGALRLLVGSPSRERSWFLD